MTTLLLATRNSHKINELSAILGPTFRFLTLADFPSAPATVEDANSFAGNATKKAVELTKWLARSHGTDSPRPGAMPDYVLADDSGLEVDALNGAPGVLSARFAAPEAKSNSKDADNNAKLLRLLGNIPLPQRGARFKCVLCLTPFSAPQPTTASPVCYAHEFELQSELFEGVCEGQILFAPRGNAGFGYDPLFMPVGQEQTFAELGEGPKNALSHRARALTKLRARLKLQS
jgi:XTP/dITP diphosphohydrolase